ncbi:endo alpha-1,4 polygalactosaminidase [Nocardioides caeni]|uniref:Glycoside-hydrolase family GH114 TIM-barrel domain-containing protein n=1 Tax=Nocardioides caeni TaxID=574700 RepID=A0A4S8N5D2_9ACTN|nr:endo alpha-1,4 polygalactosaminidase [Nocardioides caeni]THV10822.1 hypothetical protein E9934_13925 [Nocardioides caeni]
MRLVLGFLLALLVGAPTAAAVPPGVDVDYQLGGVSVPADNVGIVVRDRKADPAEGAWNVCYVNGFQTQPDERAFWRARWWLVLKKGGRPVVDSAWGEWLLDIRTPLKRQRLGAIVGRWIDGCARAGFDAVEFDNLDSWSRSHGLIRGRDAKAFARILTQRAHAAGLAAGQKNWAGLHGRRVGFDFAVAEECGRYRECAAYREEYGDQVLFVEYRRPDFDWTCDRHGRDVAVVLRDRALRPDGRRAWC